MARPPGKMRPAAARALDAFSAVLPQRPPPPAKNTVPYGGWVVGDVLEMRRGSGEWHTCVITNVRKSDYVIRLGTEDRIVSFNQAADWLRMPARRTQPPGATTAAASPARATAPASRAPAGGAAGAAGDLPITVGAEVHLSGLLTLKAANDERARVLIVHPPDEYQGKIRVRVFRTGLELRVKPGNCRVIADAAPPSAQRMPPPPKPKPKPRKPAPEAPPPEWEIGDAAEAYHGGRWYSCVIALVHDNGTCDVNWDSEDTFTADLPVADIRPHLWPGRYVTMQAEGTAVTVDESLTSEEVAVLGPGRAVDVVDVVSREGERLLRGRIKEPKGWISLQSLESGYRCVKVGIAPEMSTLSPDGDDGSGGDEPWEAEMARQQKAASNAKTGDTRAAVAAEALRLFQADQQDRHRWLQRRIEGKASESAGDLIVARQGGGYQDEEEPKPEHGLLSWEALLKRDDHMKMVLETSRHIKVYHYAYNKQPEQVIQILKAQGFLTEYNPGSWAAAARQVTAHQNRVAFARQLAIQALLEKDRGLRRWHRKKMRQGDEWLVDPTIKKRKVEGDAVRRSARVRLREEQAMEHEKDHGGELPEAEV